MQAASLTGLSILVVDDDALLRRQLAAQLERLGVDVTSAATVAEARNLAQELSYDFVLLDVHLPDGSGIDLLRQRAFGSTQGVIIMTADGGVSGAVEAVRLGALDYLVKPFDLGEIPLVVERARRGRQSARLDEHQRSHTVAEANDFYFGHALEGLERVLAKVLEADQRMIEHLPPVLIQGETGTGKTTIARWLHYRGPRAECPLVEMNCSALPETLAESELFGHERGAFTDARTARMGLIEAADGGTLFLDELPSLSIGLQAKVLKVLDDHRIRRVGGRREIPVDVRVVAATSRNLREMVAAGAFREDLLHRLDLYRIELPPLRERGEDIPVMAERLLDRLSRRHRLPPRILSEEARERIRHYPWPGNVRELAHELERALVFEDGNDLNLPQLAGRLPNPPPADVEPLGWFRSDFVFPEQGFNLEQAVLHLVHHALRQTDQNVSAAARLLGVSRDYVRYRLAGRKLEEQGGG